MTLRINFDPEPGLGKSYKESEYVGYSYGCGSCDPAWTNRLAPAERSTGVGIEEIRRAKEKVREHDRRVHRGNGLIDFTIFVARK